MPEVIRPMRQKTDTAARWASINPVLGSGEMGIDTTNKIAKIGDGTSAWSVLPGFRYGTNRYVNTFDSLSGLTVASGQTLTNTGGILSASAWPAAIVPGVIDTNRTLAIRDQWAEVKVGAANPAWTGPGVRCTPNGSYTQGVFGTFDAGYFRIWCRTPAGNTNSGDPATFTSASRAGSVALGDVLRLEVRGASEARLFKNGVEILSASNGQFGECYGMNPAAVVYGDTSKSDELRAGELPGFL